MRKQNDTCAFMDCLTVVIFKTLYKYQKIIFFIPVKGPKKLISNRGPWQTVIIFTIVLKLSSLAVWNLKK